MLASNVCKWICYNGRLTRGKALNRYRESRERSTRNLQKTVRKAEYSRTIKLAHISKDCKKIHEKHVDRKTEISNLQGKRAENNKQTKSVHVIFIDIRSIWNNILKVENCVQLIVKLFELANISNFNTTPIYLTSMNPIAPIIILFPKESDRMHICK